MIYITRDTHGNFSRVFTFCKRNKITKQDILIVLGDAGINYSGDTRDLLLKHELSELPLTIFSIHGNHERRPGTIESYRTKKWHNGVVWYERQFPNLLFAKDGEIFDLNSKKCLVIGGAYSIDKQYRLARGWHWFNDEQPSAEIKEDVEHAIAENNYQVEVILSYTCPKKYEPTEVFLPGIDQSDVDKSTEEWLDVIESKTQYNQWFCGHYHTEKKIDRLQFLFESIISFDITNTVYFKN